MENKQIEEMAKILVNGCRESNCEECEHSEGVLYPDCVPLFTANALYNAGYRKASEVAREIFEKIEKEIELAIERNYRAKKEHYNHSVIPNYDNFNAMCDGKIYAMRGLLDFMEELKKKYTKEITEDK